MVQAAIQLPPTLYPEIPSAPTPPGKGEHGYYRRGDNGWIITAPAWASYREDMEFKGNTFLPRYGRFLYDMGPKVPDARGALFAPALEPWRIIFQRGGAKEFPISQIIAFRWHIRPPYREAVFPQLKDVTIYDFGCPACEKGIFSSTSETEAAYMLTQHLTSGVNKRHEYTPHDIKELGEELGINLGRTNAVRKVQRTVHKGMPDPEPSPDLPPEMPMDVERNLAYACTCGWAPLKTSKNPRSSLQFHQRHCTGVRQEPGDNQE